ncbi:unnamed protein product [Effrenium voratum]|nr:unnamed protein product [Effrenium voratum]
MRQGGAQTAVQGLGRCFLRCQVNPSEAARKPAPPEKLANPSCFTDLLFRAEEDVFMSKRDVHTCFDVLRAPAHLQEWFGRPPVTLHELSQIGHVSPHSLQQYVVDTDGGTVPLFTPLFPTSTVWPMGFSWSSCVAQACAACCREAGVEENAFLTLESPPPLGFEACGVATDETFFFHKSESLGRERLRRLDAAFERHGMPKNAEKDVTLASAMTALGRQLTARPPADEPVSSKLVPLFGALLDVFVARLPREA